MNKKNIFFTLFYLSTIPYLLTHCSSSKKNKDPQDASQPNLEKAHQEHFLSELDGKKVALLEIQGESMAQRIVEVALVNQLIRKGGFQLIPKKEIENLRHRFDTDSTDLNQLGRLAGADYGLKIRVLQFEAPVHTGYKTEEVEDSLYAAEQGKDKKVKKTFKVKALEGKVQFHLEFTNFNAKDQKNLNKSGIAQAFEIIEKDEKNSAIHFPPQLSFLEKLTNKAFLDFFEQYNERK